MVPRKIPPLKGKKIMNTYIRNIIIVLIVNVIVFVIGWGCIVPDTINDQTHLFGLVGSVEIVKGNTSTVFGVCSVMSTLTLIIGLVEAIIEDYRPRFCPTTRNERPKKSPKISGMRIEPTSPEKCVDEDPKTPTLD